MSGDGHLLPPELPEAVDIYDTTLRDGSQQEGLSLTVDDKLRVAEQLDHLGVQYIEGGWPGANPKDAEFFARAAAGELRLDSATLVAFGSTRKAGGRAETDPVLAGLLAACTPVVCLVAKSAEWHVTETLRTSLTEAIDMVGAGVVQVRVDILSAPAVTASTNWFSVQAGAFADKDRAERLRSSLKREYGSALLVFRPGTPALWRVLVGREPTEQAAGELARRMRSQVGPAFVVRLDLNSGAQSPETATSQQ